MCFDVSADAFAMIKAVLSQNLDLYPTFYTFEMKDGDHVGELRQG